MERILGVVNRIPCEPHPEHASVLERFVVAVQNALACPNSWSWLLSCRASGRLLHQQGLLDRHDLVGVQQLWYVDNGSASLGRSVHDNQGFCANMRSSSWGPDPEALMPPVAAEALRSEMVTAIQRLTTHFVAELVSRSDISTLDLVSRLPCRPAAGRSKRCKAES